MHNGSNHNGDSAGVILQQIVSVDGSTGGFVKDSDLGSNVPAFLATPTSSNLASALTDDTGAGGALVFANMPTVTRACFCATLSADQTGIANATATKVAFNTETFDIGSYFDAVTNYRWVPPAGKVRLSAFLRVTGLTAGTELVVSLRKNGTAFSLFSALADASGIARAMISTIVDSNGTDYWEIYITGTTAGTITVASTNLGVPYSSFSGEQV